ncbi:EAL domain-containing response regulator [Aliivibrio fischeri]|uniref:EAL domain-containing response regulator n=1 Tax=Aliivibrio fischeri TaxID=668 RepID=UPI00084CCAC6|nr:EAL domain-containing protein [Aliivibrio fischeri]OED58164.1 hypothetical protein BEI47_01190 [Aliivibrio fischeri]
MTNRINVILVDDIDFSRKVVSFMIKKIFFEKVNIIEAKNSHDVDSIISKKIKIHGIITDIIMPKGDVIDLIMNLSEQNNQVPVVLVSSIKIEMISKIKKLAKISGVNIINSYKKPISSEEIYKTINCFINQEEEIEYRLEMEKESLIELFYQPILNVYNKEIIALEALISWRDVEDDSISEDVFMPKIEKMKRNLHFIISAMYLLSSDLESENISRYLIKIEVPINIIENEIFIQFIHKHKLNEKIVLIIKVDKSSNIKNIKDTIKTLKKECIKCSIRIIGDNEDIFKYINDLNIYDVNLSCGLIKSFSKLELFDKDKLIIDILDNSKYTPKCITQYGLIYQQGNCLIEALKIKDVNKWIETYENKCRSI